MQRINWGVPQIALLLLGFASSATADNHPCQGLSRDPPQEPREGRVHNSYSGAVTAVTKDSITIQWVNSPGEKPKKFAVSETLAAGKVPIEPRQQPGARQANKVDPEFMYRLTDVKVGDCVTIVFARVDGTDICDNILIARRPGGEVPPLPKEAEELRDWRIAWKAMVPGRKLPPHIENRRHVPYHEWVNALWARQAPMPRERGVVSPKVIQ